MEKIRIKKRGQVALFIILGMVVVMGIGLMTVVLLKTDMVETETPDSLNPRGFIDKCIKEALGEPIKKILEGGGELNPTFTTMYNSTNYSYLCYQGDNYAPCYNLHPVLNSQMEEEIKNYLGTNGLSGEDKIQTCFSAMKEDLEGRGYDVLEESSIYSVDILPEEIKLHLEKPVTISKGNTSRKFTEFDTRVISETYDLARVTSEIINGEATSCYFEYNGYMLINPEYKIRMTTHNGNKIYRVSKVGRNEEIKFAVRGCSLPSGLF